MNFTSSRSFRACLVGNWLPQASVLSACSKKLRYLLYISNENIYVDFIKIFMIFKIFTAISVPKETCWYKIYLLGITGDTKLARRNPSAFNCRMCSHRTIELPLPLYPGQPAPELDNPYHKEIFPTIQPKPPWHKLRPFPCVLSLVIWEQRQTCSQPAFREL